ncbi:hypothetical protein [Cohnella fermenti]|uniref:Uncharacterized protein n=1 Tax=Cohnella fermenti TaxID=2565925 RepID=A0A4S4BP99_9BACL|nr:hypothetical protein [Cohnella fermenti]THF74377.1 hypothetical protein E6C55_25375 [Cohnella fermenti]
MKQVRIEPKGSVYSVQFVENGRAQEMDVRQTYADAEDFAFYLAGQLQLDVFYLGKKVDRHSKR